MNSFGTEGKYGMKKFYSATLYTFFLLFFFVTEYIGNMNPLPSNSAYLNITIASGWWLGRVRFYPSVLDQWRDSVGNLLCTQINLWGVVCRSWNPLFTTGTGVVCKVSTFALEGRTRYVRIRVCVWVCALRARPSDLSRTLFAGCTNFPQLTKVSPRRAIRFREL